MIWLWYETGIGNTFKAAVDRNVSNEWGISAWLKMHWTTYVMQNAVGKFKWIWRYVFLKVYRILDINDTGNPIMMVKHYLVILK